MAIDLTPLMVGEKKAAALFDMKPADFLHGVASGHFPPPHLIMGQDRWVYRELRDIAEGKKARPDGGLVL